MKPKTDDEYEHGYDDGFKAGGERYEALVAACMDLLVVWEKNKNLSEVTQRIASELAELSHE